MILCVILRGFCMCDAYEFPYQFPCSQEHYALVSRFFAFALDFRFLDIINLDIDCCFPILFTLISIWKSEGKTWVRVLIIIGYCLSMLWWDYGFGYLYACFHLTLRVLCFKDIHKHDVHEWSVFPMTSIVLYCKTTKEVGDPGCAGTNFWLQVK